MQEQEAIKKLELLKEWGWKNKTLEAIDKAVEALEKQMPKKPFFGTVNRDTTYYCSSCKSFIGFYDTRIYDYCHNCGQRLDWSANNEEH